MENEESNSENQNVNIIKQQTELRKITQSTQQAQIHQNGHNAI